LKNKTGFVLFFKITTFLIPIIIILFHIFFEYDIIKDYLKNDFSVKEMVVKNKEYNSSSKRKSITFFGILEKKDVYFTKFDDEIDKIYNAYPDIENKVTKIDVIKFRNSKIVMTTINNELEKWKNEKKTCIAISLISLLIFIFLNKIKYGT
jgi:archaellum component FlaC